MSVIESGGRRDTLAAMIKNAWRENVLPGFVIQIAAVILVTGYYWLPGIASVCNALAEFKQSRALGFAIISTAIFGGLIPLLYQRLTGRGGGALSVANLVFVLLFWGYKGGEVELFYRLQAWWFGDNYMAGTIVRKVLVDQFLYNPLWSAHTVLIGLSWQHFNFNFGAMAASMRGHYWRELLPGILISTWLVWIPAVSVIYCLPQALQIPMFNLVICFFVLLASSLKKS